MPRFKKLILRPGRYRAQTPDGPKVVDITEDELQQRCSAFNRMVDAGLKIPAPWKHDDSVPFSDEGSDNNAGNWSKVWVEKDGALYGELEVPREEDASRIGTTVTEVSPLFREEWTDGLDRDWEKPTMQIALVTHPVMPGQTNFERVKGKHKGEPVLALAMSQFEGTTKAFAEAIRESQTADQTHKVTVGNATVKDALAALTKVGVTLPQDTDTKSFLAYLLTAINAITARNQGSTDQTGQGQSQPLEQPLPIAMGGTMMTVQAKVSQDKKSLEFASPEDREACQKALEASEGKGKEVKQALAFATASRKDALKTKIESLVAAGKISPAIATNKLKPLLEAYQFALDDKGKQQATELDRLLEILEALPENSTGFASLKSMLTTGNGGSGNETRFAFENANEEDLPEGYVSPGEMTDKEADKTADQQLKDAGYAPVKQD